MAGINSLKEIYDKKGEDFLKNLLNNYVIINEQMNGTLFGVKKNKVSNSFSYFKKSGQITYIDRVLMRYYNSAIAHFEKFSEEKKQRIPHNFYFGFEYLTSGDPSSSKYDRLPKNNLTLCYIHKLNEKGEPIETLQSKEDLDKWADFLDVERPPIIFEGFLEDEQKEEILNFVYTNFEELYEKFKTTSFTKYIISILNPELKSSYLKNDLDGDIEGIVFRFYEEKEENPKAKTFLAKLIDPIFEKINKENKRNENKSNDYIWLIVIDLMNFIEMYNVSKLKKYAELDSNSYDERYVKLINEIFKDFIKEFSYKYEDLILDTPEYLKREEFELDLDMIKDKKVINYIKNNETYKEIYKILLNFFRKPRKKSSSSFFNNNLINRLNLQINKIRNIIMGDEIYESIFPSFYEFIGGVEENILTQEEFIKTEEKIKSPKKVNILIDTFQPISLKHIEYANQLKNKNNLPIVLICIKSEKTNNRSPFSIKSTENFLRKIKNEYSDLIEDFKIINSNELEAILKHLRPDYEIILLGTTENRIKDYSLQLDYIEQKRIPIKLSKEFTLVQFPNTYKNQEQILNSIKNSEYPLFKKLVPKSINSEFFKLKMELNPKLNDLNESFDQNIEKENNE